MSEATEAGHPTDEELAAWIEDRLPVPAAAVLFAHLRDCAACWQRWAGLAAGVIDAPKGAPEPPLGLATYDFVLARVLSRVEPPPRMVWSLDNPRMLWASSSAFLDLACHWRDEGDLDEAHDCALHAVQLAMALPDTGNEALADLRCRTWCELGNLRRAGNDLDGAEEALCEAMTYYEAGSKYEPMLARWLDVAGSLFRDQGRFDEALDALEDACEIHLEHDKPHLSGRSKVKLGSVYLAMGKPRTAAKVFGESFPLLDRKDTGLIMVAIHNTLYAMIDARDFENAAKCIWELRQLYEVYGSPKLKVQFVYLDARVNAGLGHGPRAEKLFRRVIAAFEEAGQPYDAALAALDLAALLVERGRPADDVLAVLDDAVAAFVERQIYRELAVSFKLLTEAIDAGRNMADALATFAATVRDHSHLPGVKR